MAAFMVGKSLKDRRQHKAIEELFDKADKNGNGRISVQEYVNIFAEHGIEVGGEEVEKLGAAVHQFADLIALTNGGCKLALLDLHQLAVEQELKERLGHVDGYLLARPLDAGR